LVGVELREVGRGWGWGWVGEIGFLRLGLDWLRELGWGFDGMDWMDWIFGVIGLNVWGFLGIFGNLGIRVRYTIWVEG
jgi:hypothetical protein